MQQPDKQRAAFEAWWFNGDYAPSPYKRMSICNEDAFEIWQTAQQELQVNQQAQWQPIETAPRDGRVVDVWSKMHGRLTAYVRTDLGSGNVFYEPTEGGYTCVRDVTHWMPLPQGPNVVD